LPTDGTGDRLHRTGQLASRLVSEGHDVVWWSSTFDHARKRYRFRTDTWVDVANHYRVCLLHPRVKYSGHVSFARIINHWLVADRFHRLAYRESVPDVVLCSLPTLELSVEATAYGRRNAVPVVIDARDMWPDIFLEPVPSLMRPIAELALRPFRTMARRACSRAAAIVGITPRFVEWGLMYAGRERTALDKDFPLAYPEPQLSEADLAHATRRWASAGVTKDKFVVCFFGMLGARHLLEIEPVIDAARTLSGHGRGFLFVLCGTGDQLDYYKRLAADCPNVLFPGWSSAADMWALMQLASVGLAPYASSPSFIVSVPNKAIEYLCGGLPVVSSLKGSLAELLATHRCGITYENGNAQELAALLTDLYDHPDKLVKMSRNACALHESRFRAETVYQSMIDHLTQVCQSTRRKLEVAP
jgi:glycosyltransferase involved in cell wall biosynthesis